MAKQSCQDLMGKMTEFKDNDEFNEHVYMEISQDLVKIYDKIESDEYITLYYTSCDLEPGENDMEINVQSHVKTFKLVNDVIYLSINTKNLFTVINNSIAIHRNLFNEIKNDIDNPSKHYIYKEFVDFSQQITVYKVRIH